MSTNDQDPETILANYSRVKLQCRVDRHRWGRKVSYEQMTPSFARRYVMCTECGTQRWTEVDIKTFTWTGRSGYHYASGYLTAKTGLTLDDFRERLYSEDYAAAVKDGRVEYRREAEFETEEAPELKAVPAPRKKAS